jgi:hypothetical protein
MLEQKINNFLRIYIMSIKTIIENQYNATADTVKGAATSYVDQINDARKISSDKIKEVVKVIGGENVVADNVGKAACYMFEAFTAGMMVGATPSEMMSGTAKGLYTKATA